MTDVTAAYGTPMAQEIDTLREFRDQYLLTGKTLVDVYYTTSPPVAESITEHATLKPMVRAGLLPAVAISGAAVNSSMTDKVTVIGLLVLVSAALVVWAARRRGRGLLHNCD